MGSGFSHPMGCPSKFPPTSRAAITETTQRRFGYSSPVIGTGPELVDYFGGLAEQGVERVYAWFCDFAAPESIDGFGREVLAPLRGV